MKKQSTFALTALLILSSTMPVMATSVTNTTTLNPTFSYTNQTNRDFLKLANQDVFNDLQERKMMLEETIYGEGFSQLSLGERIVIVENYFTVRTDIHKESQKTVLSATDIVQLEKIREYIIQESDNQNKDLTILSGFVQELKTNDMSTLAPDEIEKFKEMTKKMVNSYKSLRNAGRDLETLTTGQMKVFHSSQLRVLGNFGTKAELKGDKEQALEFAKKMLKLTDGELNTYQRIVSLLNANNKSYIFVDNEVVEASIPIVHHNGGTYLDISDMSKVKGFELTNGEQKLVVKNGNNLLEVNKTDQTVRFNGTPIGKNFTLLQEDKLYLPISSTFKLFYYDVKWDKDIQSVVVHKKVYEKNEIDSLPVDSFANSLFPKAEVKKKVNSAGKKESEKTKESPKSNKEKAPTESK